MKGDKKEETIVTHAYDMIIQTTYVLKCNGVNVEEEDWSMGEDVSLIYKPMQGR
jgi:hypothetical protein